MMNNNLINTVDRSTINYKLWCLTFSFDLVPGLVPPRPNPQLVSRLLFDPARALGMRLADRYYAAGCPIELCDTAAARDIWLNLHGGSL